MRLTVPIGACADEMMRGKVAPLNNQLDINGLVQFGLLALERFAFVEVALCIHFCRAFFVIWCDLHLAHSISPSEGLHVLYRLSVPGGR